MFNRIMAPVDLAHAERLQPALLCAADIAKHYGLPITYVGVTSSGPTSEARTPEEYDEKLSAFVAGEAQKHGVDAKAHTAVTPDPTTEVDDALLRAIDETGADLVIMASHVPGALEYIWPSNGGKVASHAKCSVMLVRQ